MARKKLAKEEIDAYKRKIILSARQIANEETFKNVTVRKIAKDSKLNNAYLYKYFNNLNEILLYCSIIDLSDYYKELIDTKTIFSKNYLQQYYDIWRIFLKHGLSNRESFKVLYFSEYSDNRTQIIKEYFNLFPQILDGFPESLLQLLYDPDMNYRTNFALAMAFGNKINKEEIQMISDISSQYFRYLLYSSSSEEKEVIDAQTNQMIKVLQYLNERYI